MEFYALTGASLSMGIHSDWRLLLKLSTRSHLPCSLLQILKGVTSWMSHSSNLDPVVQVP